MNRVSMTRRTLLRSAIAGALLPLPAVASERHYQLRLIAGEPRGDVLRAGIDIVLAPGWKTYWRMPGEAGVPPQFDWTGSENARSIEVLWPAPARFIEADGDTVGYKGRVVFPVRIAPERVGEPVRLRLAMFFGVCKEVCIPADQRAGLASWHAEPAADALLALFEQRVPATADRSSPLYVSDARLDPGASGLLLTFANSPPGDLDIFIESKDTSYFHAPRREDGSTYLIAVTGSGDPRRLQGATLKLTMVTRNLALEQDVAVA